jgi:hypothetical protein
VNKKDEINHDPESLGHHIDYLPPCLDPDIKEDDREGDVRFIEDQDELKYIDDSIEDIIWLAQHFPCVLNFYPSEQVLDKLLRRSM